MTSGPLVTVVIPCYNYGRFLSDALESIRTQTYEAWECLVVDDGSTDNTRDVAIGYSQQDARFRHLYQNNSGVSAARNTALREAKGKYIQLLDADDLIEKEKLALQVAFLEAHAEVDLVYSSIVFFKGANKTDRSEPKLLLNKKGVSGRGEALLWELVEDNLFLPGCVLFRKTLYEIVGFFRTGIEGIEDWDYFYRAALLHKTFYYDNRNGTRLLSRSHDDNASGNNFKMLTNKIKARKGLMQDMAMRLKEEHSDFKVFLNKAYQLHKALLNRDEARLHLYYGSIWKGFAFMFKHAYFSKKVYFAFYDGAYWVKERLKNKSEQRKV